MEKPIKREIIAPMFYYQDIIKYVETKYKFSSVDYTNTNENGGKYCNGDYPIIAWCKKYGLNWELLEEQFEKNSEEFKEVQRIKFEFQRASDRYEFEREKKNYWLWLYNNHIKGDLINGMPFTWPITKLIKVDSPNWIKEITACVLNEFKSDLDQNGSLEVWINW